jgi:DNA-binding NtrC family response regulator
VNKKHILIVDDEEAILGLLSRLITAWRPEYIVITSQDGQTALAYLRQQAVDLVITDYHLKGMNGLEIAEIARNIWPTMPVVLMTGQGTDELRQHADSQGLTAYIEKPFTPTQVLELVETAIKC